MYTTACPGIINILNITLSSINLLKIQLTLVLNCKKIKSLRLNIVTTLYTYVITFTVHFLFSHNALEMSLPTMHPFDNLP